MESSSVYKPRENGVPSGPASKIDREVKSAKSSSFPGANRKFGGGPAVWREAWSDARRRRDLLVCWECDVSGCEL